MGTPATMNGPPPSSAQIVPTATMDEPLLQSSVPSERNLQACEEFEARAGAAAETTSSFEPAGYYDMSVIPDTRVLFPPKRPSVATASTATTSLKTKGIYSHDPILDKNPDELWRFLMSNLKSPCMAVRIEGTHTETRTRSVTNSNGTSSTQTDTETVTDFSVQIDVSKYVTPQWSRMFTRPASRKVSRDTATPTVRETVEEYTRSKNAFKEFRLLKFVAWDYDQLTKLLTDLVRSTGYRSRITVTFPMQDYKVVALASNNFSKAANSKVVRVLCVVTCLFLVFWPAWAIARKRMKNRLVCEYSMASSAEEFYFKNSSRVQSAVLQRCKQEFMVAL